MGSCCGPGCAYIRMDQGVAPRRITQPVISKMAARKVWERRSIFIEHLHASVCSDTSGPRMQSTASELIACDVVGPGDETFHLSVNFLDRVPQQRTSGR